MNVFRKNFLALGLLCGVFASGALAEVAEAGQITGRVTDASTLQPISRIEICAVRVSPPSDVIPCTRSNTEGLYTLDLGDGSYRVEFVGDASNYVTQYYNGKASSLEANLVSVVAGGTTSGIDAAMQRGIAISGKLTEAGSDIPAELVRVCALNASNEVAVKCTFSATDGTYSIMGLPLGLYVVSFAVDVVEDCTVPHPDGYVGQYYNGKATFAQAERTGSASPGEFPGIDAQLVKGVEIFPKPPSCTGLPPRVSAFKLSPSRFRAGPKGRSNFRFVLSEAAAVSIAIARVRPGRRVGKACKPAIRKLARHPRCKRFVQVGELAPENRNAGANQVAFRGKVSGRALRPGAYRATITATDPTGHPSAPQSASFTVLPRK